MTAEPRCVYCGTPLARGNVCRALSSPVTYRLADGTRWLSELSYEDALERRIIAWLAASPRGRMQDPDPSLWPLAHGPIYSEGYESSLTALRPSAIVAFTTSALARGRAPSGPR